MAKKVTTDHICMSRVAIDAYVRRRRQSTLNRSLLVEMFSHGVVLYLDVLVSIEPA